MIPLLHVHGALGAASMFQPLIHELREYANFSFDLEGHGEALPVERAFRIEHFAENLQHFIEHHSLAPARIVGYSMGGYIALWLAAHKPSLIHSIITLGTSFNWSPEHAAKEVKFLNPNRMLEKVPAFAHELEQRHHGANWRIVLEKTKEMMLDLGDNPRLTAEVFARIGCTTRYGVGDRDTMVSVEETARAYAATPGAELYVLPGTPHPLEKVQPKRWATVIRDMWAA